MRDQETAFAQPDSSKNELQFGAIRSSRSDLCAALCSKQVVNFDHFLALGDLRRQEPDSSNFPFPMYSSSFLFRKCSTSHVRSLSFASASRFWGFRVPSGLGDEVCKGKPANQSPQGKCHVWGVLGRPGLAQRCSRALLALLGCSWAAAGCSWSAPALPPESPREQPNHYNQHGPTSPEHRAPQRIF